MCCVCFGCVLCSMQVAGWHSLTVIVTAAAVAAALDGGGLSVSAQASLQLCLCGLEDGASLLLAQLLGNELCGTNNSRGYLGAVGDSFE